MELTKEVLAELEADHADAPPEVMCDVEKWILDALLAAVRERDAAVERAEEESSLRRDAESSRDYAEARTARLEEALRSLRLTQHRECDDHWYSCPKSEEGCGNYLTPKDVCTCGVDSTNAVIDAALAASPRVLERGYMLLDEEDADEHPTIWTTKDAAETMRGAGDDPIIHCIVVALDAREEVSDGA